MKRYKRIKIVLYGGALVKLPESHGSGQSRQSVTYKSREIYANQHIILWSCEQTPEGKIGPGTFDLPFQLVIPNTCLGSFKSRYGSISYVLCAHIKTGILHRDHKIEVPVTLTRITDINLPHLMMTRQISKQKTVGLFFFGSKISFTVSLSRTGFCIGHDLPLTVNVVNGSSRQIKMRASIKLYCTFRAQGHSFCQRTKLVTTISPNISARSRHTWNIEDLIVPMVAPSFEGSDIIQMQYVLKITAEIPWAINSSVKIPITLGNVPLYNYIYY